MTLFVNQKILTNLILNKKHKQVRSSTFVAAIIKSHFVMNAIY